MACLPNPPSCLILFLCLNWRKATTLQLLFAFVIPIWPLPITRSAQLEGVRWSMRQSPPQAGCHQPREDSEEKPCPLHGRYLLFLKQVGSLAESIGSVVSNLTQHMRRFSFLECYTETRKQACNVLSSAPSNHVK